ncbi:hypothetical protein [Candidatus Photodesmus anomalopis]|uniref:hypothetical protein n=1 Tax=Candidatus Photodesmus anomalopis TaxID=28176 RepID=UPI0003FB3E9C|nr:hypothetical protein [Candidatus Photodesmus katoptron]
MKKKQLNLNKLSNIYLKSLKAQKKLSIALILFFLILSAWLLGKIFWLIQENSKNIPEWSPEIKESPPKTKKSSINIIKLKKVISLEFIKIRIRQNKKTLCFLILKKNIQL